MNYSQLIEEGLKRNNFSLRKLAELIQADSDLKVDHSYLSKLRTGTKPPASDKLNDVLAKVLGIDSVELKTAAYREKIPAEVLEKLTESSA